MYIVTKRKFTQILSYANVHALVRVGDVIVGIRAHIPEISLLAWGIGFYEA